MTVYIDNPAAHARIRDLTREHVLGFLFNPGGGEFTHRSGKRCQISTCDDNEDLKKLEDWLAVNGDEIKAYNRKMGWIT